MRLLRVMLAVCVAVLIAAPSMATLERSTVPTHSETIETDPTSIMSMLLEGAFPRGEEEKRRLLLLERKSPYCYHTRVIVGFPRKQYLVQISTSTSSLLIFDRSIQDSAHPIDDSFDHTYYERSRRYKPFDRPDKNFNTPFMDGSIYGGKWGLEQVDIGGIVLHDMDIGIVDSVTPGSLTETDGILGLGISPHRPHESRDLKPPLGRLDNKKKRKFSFFLSKDGENGLLTLGYTDPALYLRNTLRYVPIVPGEPSCWTVTLDTLQLGNSEDTNKKNKNVVDVMKKKTGGGVKIEVNIGSNYLWAPRPVINNLVKLIKGARWDKDNSRVVLDDCSVRDSLPQLVFIFDNQKYAFHGTEYFEEVPFPPEVIALVTKKATTIPQCQLIILPSEESDKMQQWSLGIPFFKKFYTSFDYQKQAVGFAVAVDQLPEDDEDIQKQRYMWSCMDSCGEGGLDTDATSIKTEETCDECIQRQKKQTA